MNPSCERCSKTVYPVEKLKFLDKAWHKGCFRCQTCNVTLNLKTVKGYNKIPYCVVHYPSTKFTAVADTPENLRLKKQTTNLSLHNYHSAYKTDVLGTKMSVSDDPESLRAKKAQGQLSQVQYHGKDRTNPASTPLSRPAFSSPDAPEAEAELDDPVNIPPRSPSPEPVPEPEPEPEQPASPILAPPEEVPLPEPEEPKPPKEEEDLVPPPAPEAAAAPDDTSVQYVAVYEYTAADDDEVSMKEGDTIINGVIVGEGWMLGTNSRTGDHGMLPSNYVEIIAQ